MYSDNKIATIEEFLRKLSDHEKDPVGINDHNYVKPWSAHQDSHRTKPTKMLFMNAALRPKSFYMYPDEEIDVVNVFSPENCTPSPFDSQKSKVLANELEYSLKYNLKADTDGSELEDFQIENCSLQKRKMYEEVMELIKADTLAKLAYSGQPHELIKRKITTERCARQLRSVFANTFYDFDDLIFWIHKLILDKGDLLAISSYLNILQALRTKVPDVVDRIARSYSGHLGYDYLCQLLKKQWDPTVPILSQHKPKKLPGNPFIIMNCVGFNLAKVVDESPRFQFWTNHLNALCKTMHIPMKYDGNCTLEGVLEDSVLSLRSKIMEFKNHFPNQAVILAGWTIGALIACHVALETAVDAVLCFGFPLTGVNGSRGDLNDPLLESKVPILFIVGQNSNMCSIDDIEDFRARMQGESGLVIVGGADDLLQVSPQKLLQESITQEIVDRCILDEISDFLQTSLEKLQAATNLMSSNLIKTCPTIIEENIERDVITHEEEGKRKRGRSKEYSAELTSSYKRAKHSASKEIPGVSPKSHMSPSNSETSSSGSCKNEKQNVAKAGKNVSEERGVGRPPSSISRKKIPATSVTKSVPEVLKQKVFKAFKLVSPAPFVSCSPKKPLIMTSKSTLPFALNILARKNDPVDVEKAFGKDSSYLPRPLTPHEDTISVEETEKVMLEIETTSLPKSVPSKLYNTGFSSPIPQIIPTNDKSFMPLSEESSTAILGSKVVSGSIIKPILNSTDSKKGISVSVTSSGFKRVFQKGKVLTSCPATHLKNISTVNLDVSSLSQPSAINATKAVITIPSNTIFVSSQTLKTPSGKVFQLLTKGPVSLKAKDALTAPKLVGSNNDNESSEQQACNLSLLSDVAGMTEPLTDSSKKLDTSSPSATLVKLTVPNKSPNWKRFHVLKALPDRSLPTIIETPEETAEKQLAVQALNKSLDIETSADMPVKESGYSICYAKPDGSIISRAVPRHGPVTYIRQSIINQPSVRGRIRPILPSKTYQFYHK